MLASSSPSCGAGRTLTSTQHRLSPAPPLTSGTQARAAAALDEGWALLARLKLSDAAQAAALLEEGDRIVANLEHDCAARREVNG
jgi:hypothetical protein